MLSLRRAAIARLVAGGTAPYITQQIGQMMADEAVDDSARAAAAAAYRRADGMSDPWGGIAVVTMPSARLSV